MDLITRLRYWSDEHGRTDCGEAADEIAQLRGSLSHAASEYARGYANGSGDEGHYQREISRLRAALKTYGSHGISCPKAGLFPPTEGVGFVCTCGFEDASSREPQTPEQT